MSSVFDDFLSNMEPALDSIFADSDGFKFTPMKEVVNDEPEADLSRAVINRIDAVFADNATEISISGVGGQPMSVDSSGPRLWVQTSILSEVHRFDQFKRLSTGEVFEVTEALPDGLSRILCHLKELT